MAIFPIEAPVDPVKRHLACEVEAHRKAALERVAEVAQRIKNPRIAAATRPKIDRAMLMQFAHDPPAAWNEPSPAT